MFSSAPHSSITFAVIHGPGPLILITLLVLLLILLVVVVAVKLLLLLEPVVMLLLEPVVMLPQLANDSVRRTVSCGGHCCRTQKLVLLLPNDLHMSLAAEAFSNCRALPRVSEQSNDKRQRTAYT